jgi:hypothetical protein
MVAVTARSLVTPDSHEPYRFGDDAAEQGGSDLLERGVSSGAPLYRATPVGR